MVVIHDYSRPSPNLPSREESSEPPPRNEEIDDDRAFVVGLWIISGIVILIVLAIVLRATVFAPKKSSQTEVAPEVLGEQSTAQTNTQVQAQAPSQLPSDSTTSSTSDSQVQALKNKTPGSSVYTVQSGDTISGIGKKMGVSWRGIAELNGIQAPYSLRSGQKLVIPPKVK